MTPPVGQEETGSTAIVGIIPAAGRGERLQPLPCSKEVYPIAGKPVMDYVIERMRSAGCDELRVVTRPDKSDVIRNAERQRATVILGHPASVAESVLAGLDGLSDETFVLFGLPDTIWTPEDGFARLLGALVNRYEIALGLFRSSEPERGDAVSFEESGRVTAVEVKSVTPSSDWIWGCVVSRAGTLHGLVNVTEPGVYFHSLASAGKVVGLPFPDSFIDIGTKEALRAAARGEFGRRATP